MKKILLTLPLFAGVLHTQAATFYVDTNNGSWASPATYNSEPDGTGTAPANISTNDFDMNGLDLTNPSGPTSTFSGQSLTFTQASERLQVYALTSTILNTLNVSGGGEVLQNGGKVAITFEVGQLNATGDFFFKNNSAARDQSLSVSVTNMIGGGNLTFTDLDSDNTFGGSISLSATDASGFTGQLSPEESVFSLGSDFENATLFIGASTIGVNVGSSVSIGAIEGTSFSSIAPGTYTAGQLNTLTSTSLFSGAESLTVIPEPATYTILVSVLVASLAIGARRRNS